MKIIITEYFEKIFKKVCKDIDLSFLLNKVKVDSKNFILFKEPFFKVKIRTESKSYRLILNYEKDYMTLILVDIFDKKDKKIGENIIWNLHKDTILKSYESNLDDIEKGKYKTYKI